MYNSFISIVSIIDSPQTLKVLPGFLNKVYSVLKENFSDFEIILVNNTTGYAVDPYVTPLSTELKHHVYLLNLSSKTNRNHAIVAGLDRSNGDYTIIFELAFQHRPDLILQLYEKTRTPYDIVYLRAKDKPIKIRFRIFYRIFYAIIRLFSQLKIDDKAHNTRIISRRALNSLLKLRENLRFMKAVYPIVGYNTAYIETEEKIAEAQDVPFSEHFNTSLVAITSYTTFLRALLLWIFIFSFCFLVGVVANALKVKFTGFDLFGNVQEQISGWTFLVVLISIFFAITCLNLYIMSIYLSNIYAEIKQRPLYIIESIKRY